jgi:hypothetical protein
MSKGQLIKGGIAIVVLAAALVLITRNVTSSGFDPQANAEDIVIVCSETGEEWTQQRGFLMDQLYRRSLPLEETDGLSSPYAQGRHVAFPKDKGVWKKMLADARAQLGDLAAQGDD